MSNALATIVIVAALATASSRAQSAPNDPDPVLTPSELKALIIREYRKDEAKRLANDEAFLKNRRASEVKKYFGDTSDKSKSGSPTKPQPVSKQPQGPCGFAPHLFIRRDRLDTFQLRENAVPLNSAKGASISFTQDDLNHSNTVTANGRVEISLLGYDGLTPCENGKVGDPYKPFDPFVSNFGYVIAPWIESQGTINNPAKKGDTNKLQTGLDAQVSVFGGRLFDHQYFILTPYYQTDFRGAAAIEGLMAAWEPVAADLHLGGYAKKPNEYFDWFWQTRAEFDEKHVSTVGSTGLTRGNYQWVGGTAQLHVRLFPDLKNIDPFWTAPVPSLVNRLYANASINWYWNAAHGGAVSQFTGEVGYNLTEDGKSSISAQYIDGTDKDTLVRAQKYLVTINYKN